MPGFGMNGGQQPVAVSGFNPMPQMWAFTSVLKNIKKEDWKSLNENL